VESLPVTLSSGLTKSLVTLDAASVSMLMAAAGDIVIVVDRMGVVIDVTVNDVELERDIDDFPSWPGRRWMDCVTPETSQKIEMLLSEATQKRPSRWVQVNFPSRYTADLPVHFTAVQVGGAGHIVAVGRSLRNNSLLQQRLVDAQQTMERDYLRLRDVETRYRLLFQTSSEAVLIVDPVTQKIQEANQATLTLLHNEQKQIPNQYFPDLFDSVDARAIDVLLRTVKETGRADEVAGRLAGDNREVLVSASLFRQDNNTLLLIRIVPTADVSGTVLSNTKTALLKAVDSAPDGFVLTDSNGRILMTNAAFRDMAQIASEDQARAGSLDQWLGRTGVDMNVMVATLRQRGAVLLFATTLRGEYGANSEVEISAVLVNEGGQKYYAFVIRSVERRLPVDSRIGRELPRSVDQLTELIGRVPLKDLVREATDMIERLCILAALEMTGDNRASAAELLGLSRQSLYVKLRRHGLGDLDGDSEN
jgi:transcriptional regulator PpsR